jgi:hypothetical protein
MVKPESLLSKRRKSFKLAGNDTAVQSTLPPWSISRLFFKMSKSTHEVLFFGGLLAAAMQFLTHMSSSLRIFAKPHAELLKGDGRTTWARPVMVSEALEDTEAHFKLAGSISNPDPSPMLKSSTMC